jgi:hypothetical protein
MATVVPTPRQVPAVDRGGDIVGAGGGTPATGVVYETFTSPFVD